eukprot:8170536-Pyramimonas_sp.AAC.2
MDAWCSKSVCGVKNSSIVLTFDTVRVGLLIGILQQISGGVLVLASDGSRGVSSSMGTSGAPAFKRKRGPEDRAVGAPRTQQRRWPDASSRREAPIDGVKRQNAPETRERSSSPSSMGSEPTEDKAPRGSTATGARFADLNIHPLTKKAIAEVLQYETMTAVQVRHL